MSDKEVIVSDNEEIILKWSHLIALIILVIMTVSFFNEITLALKVNGWSTVQGTIISSELKECTHQRTKATFFIGTDGLLLSKISYRYLGSGLNL